MRDSIEAFQLKATAYLRGVFVFLMIAMPAVIVATHLLASVQTGFTTLVVLTGWYVALHWATKLAGRAYEKAVEESD